MRGKLARDRLFRQTFTELTTNLNGLDQIAQVYFTKKKDLMRLPLPKVATLLKSAKLCALLKVSCLKIEQLCQLCKWVERGLLSDSQKPEMCLLTNYAQYRQETNWLLSQVFRSLDKSNYLVGFMSKVVAEKCQPVLLYLLTVPEAMKQIRASCEKGLELHNSKILNTDKLTVSKGVEVAIGLFTHFQAKDQKQYDLAI